MNLREIEWGGMDCINPAQNRYQSVQDGAFEPDFFFSFFQRRLGFIWMGT
jgi:hypothetical protein